MEDLNTLRVIAEKIPVAQSAYIHQDILRRIVSHRQNILSSNDGDLIKDYIYRSSDDECLVILAEIANHAPLSDDYHAVFCHLARRVFTAAGLEIPALARLNAGDRGELTTQLTGLLENLSTNIRKTQRGTLRGASVQ